MTALLTTLGILAVILLLYTLSTCCRKGHPGLQALQGWAYAHRGLHSTGVPENSMAAFRAAMDGGYGIELDIHLMKDGNLAIIHDASLKRTTGAEVCIEDLTAADLTGYHLEGTDETIPLLDDVLTLCHGKVPLILELKSTESNYASLTQATCRLLESYHGAYCIESFDPRCVTWLKRNRPDIIRGQLAENFLASNGPLPIILKFILTHQMWNFLSLPDFISYKFTDRKTSSTLITRKFWGAQGVTWTITSPRDYHTAVEEGYLPIFEGFRP